MAELAPPSRTVRTVLALDRAADRRWFLPAVSFFPMADYVLWFVPNQMLLVMLAVLQPRRWPILAMTFVLAGGIGALLTAWVVQAFGPSLLEALFGGTPEPSGGLGELIDQYGLAALVLLAALPMPPRTTVVVLALAGLPPVSIGLGVAVGRTVPATLGALLGAKAPHLLRRLKMIDRVLREVEARRQQTCDRDERVTACRECLGRA